MRMRHLQLITSAEAGSVLACTPANIRKLARLGKLPVAAIVGRGQRLFRRRDVERLAAARREARQ